MFEHAISDVARIIGLSPTLTAFLSGAFLGFVIRGLITSRKSEVVVHSAARGSSNQNFSMRTPDADVRPLISGVAEMLASHSTNRFIVNIQDKQVELDGSQIAEELQKGNLIAAIKLLREQTGLGLKESKRVVEALEKTSYLTKK